MKNMKAGVRSAALAAVSAAGFIVAAQAAQAQVWFETRGWPQARYYEEAPPFYRDAPRYVAPAALPTRAVRQIIEGQGFEVIGAMRFTGDAYIVQAVDERGRVRRLVVDAHDGEIVESAPLVAQPRPPGDMGRARGPYVTNHGVEVLPGRMAPRNNWSVEQYGVPPPAVNPQERRARERFARQSPDGMEGPRGSGDLNIVPGLAPIPQAEPRKAAPPKQRAVKKPSPKAASRQQAARTPSAQTPQSAKGEPATPDAVRLDAGRTGSSAIGSTRTEPAKVEAAIAPAGRTEQPKAAVSTPQVAKPEAATGSNSMLRRPSQKADGGAATGERKGVAAGPTVSSGAGPQRKAPRVVYPGPGAPAQSADGEN